jgi:glycerophosphoryl diester phosphodiesterase
MGFTRFQAIVLVALASCSSSPAPAQMPSPPSRPRIVAHRGASHAQPENTLAAFRAAWAVGVEAVELDVHVAQDGGVVVIHDDSTKRTFGVDRKVIDQTTAELTALGVPTLADALATVPAGRTLFVEIKTGADTVEVIARAIGDRRDIALQGFDPDVLAALAKALPNAPAYWTVDPPVENDRPLPYAPSVLDEAKRRGFAGVALFHGSVTPSFVQLARDAGLLVDVWTINDATELAAWQQRDVRWIETDRPDLVPPR